MASFTDFSSYWVVSEEHLASGKKDGDRMGSFIQSLGKVNFGSIPDDRKDAMSGHNKRSFYDDKSDKGVHKLAKKLDQDSHINWSSEYASLNSRCEGRFISVAAADMKSRKTAAVSDYHVKDVSSLPWFRQHSAEEEEINSPARFSFFPGYFEDGHRKNRYNPEESPEESLLHLFDSSPEKAIPIGPNHQADLPISRSQLYEGSLNLCSRNTVTDPTSADLIIDESGSDILMGTCVMPMPETSNSWDLVGRLGTYIFQCRCPEEGSITCMRQHASEAREKLKRLLGQGRFGELGFYDMGEVVAQKWSEEEQQLFDEVVISNPASRGKNFWDVLPRAFPHRSNKEFVSYYFNVFMLQKRAEQNRADPFNVDSDDDEWQETDDVEFATTEDNDDSGVESPTDSNDVCCTKNHAEAYSYEEAEDGNNYSHGTIACTDDEELYYVSEECMCDSKNIHRMHAVMETSPNESEDHDTQDGSCTSFESQHNTVDSCGSSNNFLETRDSLVENRNYGFSTSADDYLGGLFDTITWEISHMHGKEKDADLLPTLNVIEEFGKVSWE